MRKHDDFEDDGRTIADMSDIGPAPMLRPTAARRAPCPQNRPTTAHGSQAPDWTAKEKFWAVLGAMKATLLIAGVYLAGLAVLLLILFLLWK